MFKFKESLYKGGRSVLEEACVGMHASAADLQWPALAIESPILTDPTSTEHWLMAWLELPL